MRSIFPAIAPLVEHCIGSIRPAHEAKPHEWDAGVVFSIRDADAQE